jgi:L-lactate dehydrogenase complex protein LldG
MNAVFESFKARAEAVSSEVHRFGGKGEALNFVLETLKKEGVADVPQARAVWADCPFLEGLDKSRLAAEVPGLRFEVSRELAADARIGISQINWAVANTGTLVQDAAPVAQRLVSTLPIIHIALVSFGSIFPDLPSVLKQAHPRRSGYISMITGPSRTADIERVLTIGVHGPERLIIVFVDELGGMN